MSPTRVFICHDLDLTDETQLEVQILQQLRQKLQERHAEVALYPGRASDEGFLAFFYQQLATCQWFILFQTESAVHSSGVRSAVSIAKTRVEQKQMQEILRFIALPDEAPDLLPAWSALLTFGATKDYPRALEKLLLALSLDQEAEAQTAPVIPPPVALLAATEGVFVTPNDQPLIMPPVADLETAPLPALATHGQNQVILADTLSPAHVRSSWEQTQGNPPASTSNAASIAAIDRPAKLPIRLSKGQVWLCAGLASALVLGMLLFTVVLPLHASSAHQSGPPLASSSAAEPGALPTANRTATAGAQTSATASTRGTATASARGTVSAQGTAAALGTATASTPQGLYVVTTRKAPDVVDHLSAPSRLKWDVFSYSGGGGCGYGGGSYHAAMPQAGFFATCMAEASNYANFLYQVHMTITGGSGSDGGGLVFRSTGNTAYRLHVGIDGSYDLVTPAKTLVSGASAAIKTGLNQTNRVAAAAHGSTIAIYINGRLLINLTDTTSSAGKIGLMGVDFSKTAVKVVYSDAQIWLL
jgi:hypothetical protein